MRTILAKIGNGMLFGLGASIVFGLFFVLFTPMATKMLFKSIAYIDEHEYDEHNSGLSIIHHSEERLSESDMLIFGTIKNQGSESWKQMGIEVEFYNEDGELVDEAYKFVEPTVNPGEEEDFMIRHKYWKGEKKIPEYSELRLRIIGADYVKRN